MDNVMNLDLEQLLINILLSNLNSYSIALLKSTSILSY